MAGYQKKHITREFFPQSTNQGPVRNIQSYTDGFQKHFYFCPSQGPSLGDHGQVHFQCGPWECQHQHDATEFTGITRAIAPIAGAIVMIKVLKFSVDPRVSAGKVYCHTVLIKRVLNFSAMIKSKLLHAQK